jgi:acyl-CoA synthetase (AMP-forming)/AMP-acid ligase II
MISSLTILESSFSMRHALARVHAAGFGKGDRIALILPNGPELALAIVSVAHWASCVPLSANGAVSELQADLLRAGVNLAIGRYAAGPSSVHTSSKKTTRDSKFHVMDADHDWAANQEIQDCATSLQIPFLGMLPSPKEAGIFRLVAPPSNTNTNTLATPPPVSWQDAAHPLANIRSNTSTKKHISAEPNNVDNEVLVLFTSDTSTGNKKLVPHQLGDMLTAATTIALSWNLSAQDVSCNLMPLFHVGGIVQQTFSPLVSGSAVICCPSFDPNIFWVLAAAKRAFKNWYYAAPTMHPLILQTGRQPPDTSPSLTLEQEIQPRLRMITNEAGGLVLLPSSLAIQLHVTFGGANVLPAAYGMLTAECMPIMSPPRPSITTTYQLTKEPAGSPCSGVAAAAGPEIAILNTSTITSLPIGQQETPICVPGGPGFRGHGKIANDPSSSAVVVIDTFMKDGWFNSDEDGYRHITGRGPTKEVIDRGAGEIIRYALRYYSRHHVSETNRNLCLILTLYVLY